MNTNGLAGAARATHWVTTALRQTVLALAILLTGCTVYAPVREYNLYLEN